MSNIPVDQRPRFKYLTDAKPEDIISCILSRINHPDCAYGAKARRNLVSIYLPRKEQTFWSPHLELSFDEEDPNHTLIRGLIAPQPSVWTSLMFGYAVLSISALITLMIGLSQISLDHEPVALWVHFGILGAIGILFMIARMGKQEVRPQMIELHDFLMECIGTQVRPIPEF